MKELLERKVRKNFVVSLNGTSVETFHAALATAGVAPERVKPADVTWDEVFADLISAGEGGPK
jgi:hypothetical protein